MTQSSDTGSHGGGEVAILDVMLEDLLGLHIPVDNDPFTQYQDISPAGFYQQQSASFEPGSQPATSYVAEPLLVQSSPEEIKRKKNSEAAKASRLKKKNQERELKEKFERLEVEKRKLRNTLFKYKSMYLNSLSHLRTKAAFSAYIRQNKELVKDPDAKPVLQQFMATGFHQLF